MAIGDKHKTNNGQYEYTEKGNKKDVLPGDENYSFNADEYNMNQQSFINIYNLAFLNATDISTLRAEVDDLQSMGSPWELSDYPTSWKLKPMPAPNENPYDIDANNGYIQNLPTPFLPNDATNKKYVDDEIKGVRTVLDPQIEALQTATGGSESSISLLQQDVLLKEDSSDHNGDIFILQGQINTKEGVSAHVGDITNLQLQINNKQDNLISETNIKTIEGQSLLGSGNIDLQKADVGLDQVDNTRDINKPVSTATQTALNLKANQTDLTALQNQVNALTFPQPFVLSYGQISVLLLGVATAQIRGRFTIKKGQNIYNFSSINTAQVNTQNFAINDFGTTWRYYLSTAATNVTGTNITATLTNGSKTLQSTDAISMSFPNTNQVQIIFRDNTTTPPTITFDISGLA